MKVNIHPTRSRPRNRVWRHSPTVFSQPNTSSTRLRKRWLTPVARVAGGARVERGALLLRHVRRHVERAETRDEVPVVVVATLKPDEFRDATLRALRHWRFTPGWTGQVEEKDLDGDGTPDYRRMTRLDFVPVFYDVRFDFAIVGGEGTVTTSAAPPG